MQNQETVSVILVKDDDGHATLVEKNLRRAGIINGFMRLKAGQEALDYFFRRETERCHEFGCNVYVTKLVEYEASVDAIRRLGFFLQVENLQAIIRSGLPS